MTNMRYGQMMSFLRDLTMLGLFARYFPAPADGWILKTSLLRRVIDSGCDKVRQTMRDWSIWILGQEFHTKKQYFLQSSKHTTWAQDMLQAYFLLSPPHSTPGAEAAWLMSPPESLFLHLVLSECVVRLHHLCTFITIQHILCIC